jgi:16S rRNA (cytidine1402-2'-O)-methyltransferase
LAHLARTLPTSKAAAEASKLTGVSKKELYQRLLDMKGGDGR